MVARPSIGGRLVHAGHDRLESGNADPLGHSRRADRSGKDGLADLGVGTSYEYATHLARQATHHAVDIRDAMRRICLRRRSGGFGQAVEDAPAHWLAEPLDRRRLGAIAYDRAH